MARTTAQLRDVVIAEGGFDSTLWSTAAVGWLNERQKTMVSEANFRFADDYAIATTVADQAVYTLPSGVVQIEWVEVGGDRYERASPAQLEALAEGDAYGGSTYWFAEAASADAATKQVRLYPAPSTTGTAVTAGRASIIAADLDTSSSNPIIPEDLEPQLIAGAIATGKKRTGERPDAAQSFEDEFADGVQKLKRRKGGRVGKGAVSIPVWKRHFG